MKKNIFILAVIIWSGILLCQNVVINEFLASNDATVADNYAEFDDWIEFYNISSAAVDMSGWYLSDDVEIPDKWTFPNITISAGGYLIIWADDDEEQGDNHAGFKLSASGETILLSDNDLNPIDQTIFGVQTTDISMGRYPNGSGDFIQMFPTFEVENIDNYNGSGDQSDLLFQDYVVQEYDLHFYVDNWADSLEYYYYNGEEYFPAQLTYNDTVILDSIGVRYKGNSSYMQSSTTPKKPFKFRFDKYIDDQLLCEVAKLNFSNCVKDPTFMREVIGYQIIEQFVPSPRTTYANILIDGELLGFYVQVEQVDEIFINRHYSSEVGNLYKAGDDGSTMLYRGLEQTEYESEYELKTNEDENDWSDLISMIDNLNNCSATEFIATMENLIDLDGCAAMLAFNMVLSHFDSYTGSGRNFYLYHDSASDQFKFLPWDLNETFGSYNNNWDVITQDVLDISNLNDRPLNQRLLENDELRQAYLGYISTIMNGAASYDSICVRISELQDFLDPYVLADQNKIYSYQDFQQNIDEDVVIGLGQIVPGLKSFSLERNAELLQQISNTTVYPGDCDNNGIVDEFDILPIGVSFLQTGFARSEISFLWQQSFAIAWNEEASTFADANGDGVISELDIIGIGVNWGNTHSSQTQSYAINPENFELLNQYRSTFQTIYNSLSGSGSETDKIKFLLESIYDFSNNIPSKNISINNYPNPFNPSTTITFSLNTDAVENIEISIYNLKGQKVKSFIIDPSIDQTINSVIWNGTNNNNQQVSSGIYFYKLETGKFQKTKKMMLMK